MTTRLTLNCICLTCGVRNDHSHPNGFCQNGHDNWLEARDLEKGNPTFQLACNLTGWKPGFLIKMFVNPEVTYFPIKRRLHDEMDIIIDSGRPFDWNSIEINEWEIDYRMLRMDGDAVCLMCQRTIIRHPMETRTKGDPWLHQTCYGALAKT